MTRATSRQYVFDWLDPNQGSGIPFLSTVQQHPPKVNDEGLFVMQQGLGTGAIIFLAIGPGQQEHRIAIGGAHSGRKWRSYPFKLLCFLRSVKPQSEAVGEDNDTFLDGLVARIEADRTLGTYGLPNPIFQAGEGEDTGGDDIIVNSDLPQLMGGQLTQVFTSVELTVVETLDT